MNERKIEGGNCQHICVFAHETPISQRGEDIGEGATHRVPAVGYLLGQEFLTKSSADVDVAFQATQTSLR